MTETLANELLEFAIKYRSKGWSVIPLQPNGKRPMIDWKPYQDKLATEDQIRDWWKNWPDANIGIVTGEVSGIIVVDEDETEAIGDRPIAPTVVQLTSKGRHILFKHPGYFVKTMARILPNVDIRGDGGYIVATPSLHRSGQKYAWAVSPFEQQLSDMPSWLSEVLNAESNGTGETKDWKMLAEGAKEGERNDRLASFLGKVLHELSEDLWDSVGVAAALRFADNCDPPLPHKEALSVYKSISNTVKLGKSEFLGLEAEIHETDLGNARRLVGLHGEDLRFCHEWRKWLVWECNRWACDQSGEVERRAKATIRAIYMEAGEAETSRDRKRLAKHALTSESAHRIRQMILLAQSEPSIPIAPQDLDKDVWKLNCLNGTIDLANGQLHRQRREDLITKLAPVHCDESTDCPLWLHFLSQVTDGNDELVGFLKRAIGYSFTGDTSEQALFILYGTGANGKSTFINVICRLLGDYAMQTPIDTFMVKRSDSIPNDLARLQAARFVSAVEFEEGRRIAEPLIKQLTGGDRIAARFLHQEFFEFIPNFKIWIGTNHKPTIRGNNHAIWRRIKLIPFTVTIPDEGQDKELLDKLEAEMSGILNWAIEGCLQWQRYGLKEPRIIYAATDQYRREMDLISEFIEECCIEGSIQKVKVKDLYASYSNWCEVTGEYPLKKRSFRDRLRERGFDTRRGTGNYHFWQGIGLKLESDLSD